MARGGLARRGQCPPPARAAPLASRQRPVPGREPARRQVLPGRGPGAAARGMVGAAAGRGGATAGQDSERARGWIRLCPSRTRTRGHRSGLRCPPAPVSAARAGILGAPCGRVAGRLGLCATRGTSPFLSPRAFPPLSRREVGAGDPCGLFQRVWGLPRACKKRERDLDGLSDHLSSPSGVREAWVCELRAKLLHLSSLRFIRCKTGGDERAPNEIMCVSF